MLSRVFLCFDAWIFGPFLTLDFLNTKGREFWLRITIVIARRMKRHLHRDDNAKILGNLMFPRILLRFARRLPCGLLMLFLAVGRPKTGRDIKDYIKITCNFVYPMGEYILCVFFGNFRLLSEDFQRKSSLVAKIDRYFTYSKKVAVEIWRTR